jgi:hypothetical protein
VHLPRVLAHVGCALDWAGAGAALEANYAGRQGALARHPGAEKRASAALAEASREAAAGRDLLDALVKPPAPGPSGSGGERDAGDAGSRALWTGLDWTNSAAGHHPPDPQVAGVVRGIVMVVLVLSLCGKHR